MKNRTTRIRTVVAALAALSIMTLPALAEWITVGMTAQVTQLQDPRNLLGGTIAVGSLIQGIYTYDTATPAEAGSSAGQYWHYEQPAGIQLTAGGYTFRTNPANVRFLVGLADGNKDLDEFVDYYYVSSYNNLPVAGGVMVDMVLWHLSDYAGNALSDELLPTIAPDLTLWEYSGLNISGGRGGTAPCFEEWFGISATIVSLETVPEPCMLLLFGAALPLLRRFRKHA